MYTNETATVWLMSRVSKIPIIKSLIPLKTLFLQRYSAYEASLSKKKCLMGQTKIELVLQMFRKYF